jgi:hypothetical protein
MRKNYEQLVARRESAQLGVKLDQSAQLADFRIVEPPRVSPAPVFPNHLMLAIIMLLLSVVGGVAAVVALDRVFPSYHTTKSLRESIGRPVLGAVSMHVTAAAQEKEKRSLVLFLSGGALLIVCQLGWIGWLAMHARHA